MARTILFPESCDQVFLKFLLLFDPNSTGCISRHDEAYSRPYDRSDQVQFRFLKRAKSSNDIREGVVALQTGAWFETGEDGTELQGNPNILTLDVGTSRIGQGSSAHTTLINISKYNN